MTESKLPANKRDALVEAGWVCYGKLPEAISLCDEHWGKDKFVAYVYGPMTELERRSPGMGGWSVELEAYGELADGVTYRIGMHHIEDSLNPEVLEGYCKKLNAMMEVLQ